MRASPSVIGLSLLVACGGGSGGSAPPAPTLVAAATVASGAAPAPGDTVLLFLSHDVQLTGAMLDDADLALAPAGATLGAVPGPPLLLSPRVVQVPLGPGVMLTPGTTTLTFSAQNDAVRSTGGALAVGGTPQVLTDGDGSQPVVTALTLNEIDGELDGTGPAGGTLQVPRSGFTIDIGFTDPSPIDPAATVVAANVPVQTSAGAIAPGASLTAFLVPTLGATTLSYLVQPSTVFPDGPVTLTVFVVDVTGMVSVPATFSFLVRNLDDGVRPFETTVNASQLWLLDITRDVESYVHPGTTISVDVVAGANGRSDLEDLWALLGLFGSSGAINATVHDQIMQQTLTELAGLYAGANIAFTLTPPGAFPASTTVPYNSFSFSQICIAGSEDTTGATGILGVAIFDPHNDSQDDNCRLDFAGMQRLGVFIHTMVNLGLGSPPAGLFRTTYDPFTPTLGGVPIGQAPDMLDAQRLSGMLQDARATAISIAIARMARSIAVVTAHECGHSMGLVRDGAMPGGLYGNLPAFFPGSAPSHIRNSSLFPPGSQNVMSPAISFSAALSQATAFNSLNMAYLRERAIYNDN